MTLSPLKELGRNLESSLSACAKQSSRCCVSYARCNMVKKRSIETGIALEARTQRLFMCQGAFAERGLLLRPARAATNLVSDVDVVAHDYSINFYHTRIYAECKGGAVSTLDR